MRLTNYLAAIAFCTIPSTVFAQESSPNFPVSSRWEPLYRVCMDKMQLQGIAPLRLAIQTGHTTEEIAQLEALVETSENFAVELCSCYANKTELGVQAASYDISDREIATLASAFKFEIPLGNQDLSDLFAYSTLPCNDLEPEPTEELLAMDNSSVEQAVPPETEPLQEDQPTAPKVKTERIRTSPVTNIKN